MQEREELSFQDLVAEIACSEEYLTMREIKHHYHSNTYDHSILVAQLCFRHCQKGKSKVNLREAVRAALLHDYFLYDRRKKETRVLGLKHNIVHPRRALENALKAYPDLSTAEQDAILRHMFPLTLRPPKTRCGWLVCFYDKVASFKEFFRFGKTKKVRNLSAPRKSLRRKKRRVAEG